MNAVRTPVPAGRRRGTDAFTMVELALCIGIIAFAMVAIMGVLPSGLSVQRQNREDTIIDQEGPQWINILRNGQGGWGDLTNYVEYVQVEHTPVATPSGRQVFRIPGPFTQPLPEDFVRSTSELISLLSIPKYEVDSGAVYSNRVTAVFRSLSGAQNSQVLNSGNPGFRPSDRQLEDAFRYQIDVELLPTTALPSLDMTFRDPVYTNLNTQESFRMGGYLNAWRLDPNNVRDIIRSPAENRPNRDLFTGTLYDLRITFRWPVFKVGNEDQVGSGSRTFRTQVSGRPVFSLYTNNVSRPADVYLPGTSIRPRRFDPATLNRDLSL